MKNSRSRSSRCKLVLGLALGDAYGRPWSFGPEMLFEIPTYPLTRMILCGQMIHICLYIWDRHYSIAHF